MGSDDDPTKEGIHLAGGEAFSQGASAVALRSKAMPAGGAVLNPQLLGLKAEHLASAAGLQEEGGAGHS